MSDHKNWFKIPASGKQVLKLLNFVRVDNTTVDEVRIYTQMPDQIMEEESKKKFSYTAMMRTINKYKLIERLTFYYDYIGTELFMKLLATPTEIQEIHFDSLLINVSEKVFLEFCNKFKSVTFKEVSFQPNLYVDKIFRDISKHATFLLGHPHMDYYHCKVDKVALTDDFLYALTDESMRAVFSIAYLYTECTVDGIDYLIKSAFFDSMKIISWDFGFLNKREQKRADSFMEKTNKTSESYNIFKTFSKNEYVLYSVYNVDDLCAPCITFRVVINEPIEWAIQ